MAESDRQKFTEIVETCESIVYTIIYLAKSAIYPPESIEVGILLIHHLKMYKYLTEFQ